MKYTISVDLSPLLDGLHSVIDSTVLPTVSQAVGALAAETTYRWKDGVAKAKLWQGEKQPYMDSIRWIMTGDFSAVVSTDYKLAEEIEQGRPARDMKKMLPHSAKSRIVKTGKNAGKLYLIIPFRHNTPGNNALAQPMPDDVYAAAKKLKVSRVASTGMRMSQTKPGVKVPERKYSWGESLPAGMRPKMKPTHATDIYAGMVRFNTSAGKAKSSAYLTFRVMGEWSSGWIIPAKPGLLIAKSVVESISPLAPKVFGAAIAHLK